MSIDDDIEAILSGPAPQRRYLIGSKRFAAFYKVGQSWVMFVRMPGGGIIHLGHWKWWEPIRMLPIAMWKHWRFARQRS